MSVGKAELQRRNDELEELNTALSRLAMGQPVARFDSMVRDLWEVVRPYELEAQGAAGTPPEGEG